MVAQVQTPLPVHSMTDKPISSNAKRQRRYIEKLKEEKGARFLVTLDATSKANMDKLLEAEPGLSKKDLIHRLLARAAMDLEKRS